VLTSTPKEICACVIAEARRIILTLHSASRMLAVMRIFKKKVVISITYSAPYI